MIALFITTAHHTRSDRGGYDDADETGASGGDGGGSVKLRTGLKLLCQDQFPSKYTGQTMFKWRPAEIVDMVRARGRNTAKKGNKGRT